ncbi:NAD(P)-dependent oxidoreductase [Cupriavidus sp. 30B13]|uniref:NAD(P)-dependent oxidoreductase n=1 Tax=Cupriavidus sp. 30B13 TaxID=3384241 RepID=UPI003B90406F
MTNANLGFIGLGVMGEPMCSNLIRKSGRTVHVYDMNSAPVERIAGIGGVPSLAIKNLAGNVEIVFLSLPSIAEVEAVCFGEDGLASPGASVRIIVDTSTSDVQRSRLLASRLRERGIRFIDAPVARLRKGAVEGTLLFMVGSDQSGLQDIQSLLQCMGTDIVPCGAVGNGQATKILNNMVMIMTVNALAEALAIGRKSGVDGETLFKVFGLGSANSFVLQNQARTALLPDAFPEGIFPTTYAIKDVGLALELARNAQVYARGAEQTHSILEQTRDAGFATHYYPIMIKLIEQGVVPASI